MSCTSQNNMEHEQTLRIRNKWNQPLGLRLEPWGDEATIEPGESLDLIFTGPAGGTIEVETEPSGIVVYGWVGSTVETSPGA